MDSGLGQALCRDCDPNKEQYFKGCGILMPVGKGHWDGIGGTWKAN